MKTEELLEERGRQYGSFEIQVGVITEIMKQLQFIRDQEPNESVAIIEEDIETFFLVLKLVRMQTSSDRDSLDDLIGYATLIRDKRYPNQSRVGLNLQVKFV